MELEEIGRQLTWEIVGHYEDDPVIQTSFFTEEQQLMQ